MGNIVTLGLFKHRRRTVSQLSQTTLQVLTQYYPGFGPGSTFTVLDYQLKMCKNTNVPQFSFVVGAPAEPIEPLGSLFVDDSIAACNVSYPASVSLMLDSEFSVEWSSDSAVDFTNATSPETDFSTSLPAGSNITIIAFVSTLFGNKTFSKTVHVVSPALPILSLPATIELSSYELSVVAAEISDNECGVPAPALTYQWTVDINVEKTLPTLVIAPSFIEPDTDYPATLIATASDGSFNLMVGG